MAAGEDALAKMAVGVGDAQLVEFEAGNVVTRGGIRIHQAEILSLELVDRLVRASGLEEENRIVASAAVGIDVVGEGMGLDAGQPRTRKRRRAVARDMDVAGALPFDDSGVVVGDAQIDLHPEFLGKVSDERGPALRNAGGVLGRHHRESQFGILALPALRRSCCSRKASAAALAIMIRRLIMTPSLV